MPRRIAIPAINMERRLLLLFVHRVNRLVSIDDSPQSNHRSDRHEVTGVARSQPDNLVEAKGFANPDDGYALTDFVGDAICANPMGNEVVNEHEPHTTDVSDDA